MSTDTKEKKKRKILPFVILGVVLVFMMVKYFQFQNPYMPSNKYLIGKVLDQSLPGYTKIDVLDRRGAGNIKDPLILTLAVALDSYPDAVMCQGQITYFFGDPYYLEFQWSDLECTGQDWLIQRARYWLQKRDGPEWKQCQVERVAFILKHWVEKELITLDDIHNTEIRTMAGNLLQQNTDGSEFFSVPIVKLAHVYDLVPDWPEDKKVPTYHLHCNGDVDLYLAESLASKGIPAISWDKGDTDLNTSDQSPLASKSSMTREIIIPELLKPPGADIRT